MDWHALPDILAGTFLVCAFASVCRYESTPGARMWITGWLMILLHFCLSVFHSTHLLLRIVLQTLGMGSLFWAGMLFMFATLPRPLLSSTRWMMWTLYVSNAVVVLRLVMPASPEWFVVLSSLLPGIGVLTVFFMAGGGPNRFLRSMMVAIYTVLSVVMFLTRQLFLGSEIAQYSLLATVYLCCCVHFWKAYRRATAGSFVTIAGFLCWASVFIVAPLMAHLMPAVSVEREVWNLPKYIVAIGMILLLLENQIEHNKYLALHDELTGLANRRLFQDRLANALERSRRSGMQTALLLLDLDYFKQVNDTLGHPMGDLLLKHVAHVVSGRVRKADTLARTGGDEFSILLEEPINRAHAEQVGASLVQLLEQPVELGGKMIQVGASLGAAIFPDDARDAESLLILADQRMYEQKNHHHRHRNAPVIHSAASVTALQQKLQDETSTA